MVTYHNRTNNCKEDGIADHSTRTKGIETNVIMEDAGDGFQPRDEAASLEG